MDTQEQTPLPNFMYLVMKTEWFGGSVSPAWSTKTPILVFDREVNALWYIKYREEDRAKGGFNRDTEWEVFYVPVALDEDSPVR